jgi:hypothetical protein
MKNFTLIAMIFISSVIFNGCSKEISEPDQKADGSDVMYLRVDDKEEYLLDSRNKRLHKNTAGKFTDFDSDVIRYSEFKINNRTYSYFSMYFIPYNYEKAEFNKASISLRIDKETQLLDTVFLREELSKTWGSAINFDVRSDEFKSYYVDSILDYKIIKWDQENKIFTFSANCTYIRSPKTTPSNPKVYFYLDVKYTF